MLDLFEASVDFARSKNEPWVVQLQNVYQSSWTPWRAAILISQLRFPFVTLSSIRSDQKCRSCLQEANNPSILINPNPSDKLLVSLPPPLLLVVKYSVFKLLRLWSQSSIRDSSPDVNNKLCG